MNRLLSPDPVADSMPRRLRVAWLFTHRIQYFTNLLDELETRGHTENLAVYAIETSNLTDPGFQRTISWDNRPTIACREIVLNKDKPLQGLRFWSSFSPNLSKVLDREQPDAVMINGYSAALSWQGMAWCLRRGVPYTLRGDGDTLRRRAWWKTSVRRRIVAPAASRAAVVFYQGDENKKFWQENGVEADRLTWVPCVSDTRLFGPAPFRNEAERSDFRMRHGAGPREVVFLCSGKLEPRKRQGDLLAALARADAPRAAIWFLGSGPDTDRLRDLAVTLGVADRCRWLGFQNQTAIPRYLAGADVLAHPSEHDPWPYAILEGARLGLPLLLSDRVGSTPDWLAAPTAALAYPCGNIDALAAAISRLDHDDKLRRSLGDGALAQAETHTEQMFAEITETALAKLALQRPKPDPAA